MEKGISLLGVAVVIGLAFLLSANPKKVNIRLVISGILFQFLFAVIVLWTTPGQLFFEGARSFVMALLSFAGEGSELVFGVDYKDHFFAFAVLPIIVFFSSLMAVLFHVGFMQKLVSVMSWLIIKVMRVSGAESLATCANVFIGQTEAPFVVRPYLSSMTQSELMLLMVGGFATVSGAILGVYVSFGASAGHLLAASVMSAPAAIVIAKILLPEMEQPQTLGKSEINLPSMDTNVVDAACRGATEGLSLAGNVLAMLIAFVALGALANFFLGFFPDVFGAPLTFERIFGWFFTPIAFVIGVSAQDAAAIGAVLGKKIFLNEILAYQDLQAIRDQISERSFVIATYALCGFANFSSMAIQVGGMGALVPSRRKDLARLSFKAMLGGTLAAYLTAAVAGALI